VRWRARQTSDAVPTDCHVVLFPIFHLLRAGLPPRVITVLRIVHRTIVARPSRRMYWNGSISFCIEKTYILFFDGVCGPVVVPIDSSPFLVTIFGRWSKLKTKVRRHVAKGYGVLVYSPPPSEGGDPVSDECGNDSVLLTDSITKSFSRRTLRMLQ
jgi:hypothetical protein